MASIGFIGLGIMGLPMATNLVREGHRVYGFSRTAETRRRAHAHGIKECDSVASAVAEADIIITMLPDTPDVQGVLLGTSGVFENARGGSVVVDMSTIDPGATRELHRQAKDKQLAFLDAPVSGGDAGAAAGQLSIMVGGDLDVLEQVRPVLDILGSTIVHVGEAGSGQIVKCANQIVVAGNIQVLAEALIFLRKQGTDVTRALDVLAGGLAGSTVIQRKRESLLSGSFDPGFRLELHHKDLGIAQATARASGVAMPVAALVAQMVQSMIARGDGALDHSALYALAAELNGEKL
jgi:2-hydroxy-3-oxopropionate reductase